MSRLPVGPWDMEKTGAIVLQTEQLVVVDDFLPLSFRAKLFRQMVQMEYRSVHGAAWQKVFMLRDGSPLTTQSTSARDISRSTIPINVFLNHVQNRAIAPESVVNQHAWNNITASAWVYPVGTG